MRLVNYHYENENNISVFILTGYIYTINKQYLNCDIIDII
jgi:hypothetical protein